MGVPGALVQACSPLDPPCASELSHDSTDDAGLARVTFGTDGQGNGLTGFLSVDAGGDWYPDLFFWGFRLSEPTVSVSFPLLQHSSVAAIAASNGFSVDPDRAGVVMIALDCMLVYSPGMSFALDSDAGETQLLYKTGPFYLPGTATDGSGTAIFANAPVGTLTVTATPAGHDTPSSVVHVVTRASTATFVTMPPNQ